ncbi:MAG: trimethylamine methyltransferase family protein [Desulfobacterales bacterium]
MTISTSTTEKATYRFRMLSDDQIEEIKWAAFDVLRTVGVKVRHAEARKMLKRSGAVVKEESVKVPEYIVRECLRSTPKGFTIFDRQGKRAMEVQGRKSHFGTSTASPTTQDARTGEIHPTLLEDIALGARVADGCEHIDFVMPFGSSQDAPARAIDLHEFPQVVANTTKPIVFIGYSGRGVARVYEMAAAVAGGLDQLQERPFVMAYPEPIAPLVYPVEVCDRIFTAADLDMPQIPGATIQLGATGPMTVAGAVAHGLVEGLMAIVLGQLRRPGCPMCLSTNAGILDMSTGLMTFGAPTNSTLLIAHAEVAQSLGLPTWGLAGATDAKVMDAQAGAETMFHILAQALGGLNLIHDVGYIDSAMACSPQQLVFGNEAIGMVKHFLKGFPVNRASLAREVMEAVGPGGHFLTQDHTFQNFREVLWRPKLMNRQPRQVWEEAGSQDMGQVVQQETLRILDTHKVPELDGKILDELERIKQEGTQELAAD